LLLNIIFYLFIEPWLARSSKRTLYVLLLYIIYFLSRGLRVAASRTAICFAAEYYFF